MAIKLKANLFKGIQFKILKAFMLSIFLSAILTTFMLFKFLKSAYNVNYNSSGEWANNHLKLTAYIMIVSFIIFVIITTAFFYIFTRKIIYNINDINENINEISKGNFKVNIKVNTKDEIGQIANNINIMSRKLEELIEKDRENERMKNEMISNISHDIRTPLTSVIGYVEAMKKLGYKDKEASDNCMEIILKKCDELKKLVNDLLEYTSINFKGINIKKDKLSITDVLEQIMIGFIPMLEKSNMTFNIKAPYEKIFISGDVHLILRLFENIINNNIFYGGQGKKLDIEISQFKSMASVSIKNYGKKIPKEDIPYIFERFFRSEKSRNNNTGGKGMGLAIAKSIAEVHKGDIKVTSSDTETVFQILLPISQS